MNKMNIFDKSKVKPLLVLALLALTLPMVAWLVGRTQLIQKRAACAVNVKLAPASGSYARSAPFTVNLQIEAGAAAVATANVNLSFDASKLKINSIVLGSALNTQIIKSINNTNGTAQIMAFDAGGTGVTGTFNFATIQFEGLVVGSTPVAVTIGSTEITAMGEGIACGIGTKTNGAYTITVVVAPTNTPVPAATNTPVPTATPTGIAPTPTGTIVSTPTPTGGAGGPQLQFYLKGPTNPLPKYRQNGMDGFRARFIGNGTAEWYFGAAIGDNGLTLSASMNNTLIAQTYDIYIKGPMHLQKKFPSVSVAAGAQAQMINLTTRGPRYYLEPGDLAISGANKDQQDGVVNALDAVYLTGCFATPNDATCLAKADLNLDGIISTIDMELMNGTVYSKWEDEVN